MKSIQLKIDNSAYAQLKEMKTDLEEKECVKKISWEDFFLFYLARLEHDGNGIWEKRDCNESWDNWFDTL